MKMPTALQVIMPKAMKPKGTANTPTFDPASKNEVLTFAEYQSHKVDLFEVRQEKNSQEIIRDLAGQDPDLANTIFSYLTVSNTEPVILARDLEGNIDRDAIKLVQQLLLSMGQRNDYTLGYQNKKSLKKVAEEIRHMLLIRGSAGCEAIYDETYMLKDIRHVDMYTVRYYEKEPGNYKPIQESSDGKEIKLDIPSFFICDLYKRPLDAYAESPFTTAINAIAATQQVINDLYRIMTITGYPRLDVKVLEEVVMRNAPAEAKADLRTKQLYINSILSNLTSQFFNLRPDLPAVHLDSVEMSMLNDRNPGIGIDITHVIKVLDAQKQSGLHTLSTLLGRGESGVNTATVEARLFTMNADAVNKPVGEILSHILTQAVRIMGSESVVTVEFPEPELRSDTELEAQLQLRQSRLRSDLSYGLISDDEYHLRMYNRLAPEGTPEMSGTLFEQTAGIQVDATKVSPNSDPLGRSVSQASDKSAKSNSVSNAKKSRQKA